MSRDDGIIGVSDHGGWAVLVTAGTILVLRPALAERLRERRSLNLTS